MMPEPGTCFVLIARVQRPAITGEPVPLANGQTEPLLRADNKFWATIPGQDKPFLCLANDAFMPQRFEAAAWMQPRFPDLFTQEEHPK